jgi:hypothetical protein
MDSKFFLALLSPHDACQNKNLEKPWQKLN